MFKIVPNQAFYRQKSLKSLKDYKAWEKIEKSIQMMRNSWLENVNFKEINLQVLLICPRQKARQLCELQAFFGTPKGTWTKVKFEMCQFSA